MADANKTEKKTALPKGFAYVPVSVNPDRSYDLFANVVKPAKRADLDPFLELLSDEQKKTLGAALWFVTEDERYRGTGRSRVWYLAHLIEAFQHPGQKIIVKTELPGTKKFATEVAVTRLNDLIEELSNEGFPGTFEVSSSGTLTYTPDDEEEE